MSSNSLFLPLLAPSLTLLPSSRVTAPTVIPKRLGRRRLAPSNPSRPAERPQVQVFTGTRRWLSTLAGRKPEDLSEDETEMGLKWDDVAKWGDTWLVPAGTRRTQREKAAEEDEDDADTSAGSEGAAAEQADAPMEPDEQDVVDADADIEDLDAEYEDQNGSDLEEDEDYDNSEDPTDSSIQLDDS